jgi:hypothetical protein
MGYLNQQETHTQTFPHQAHQPCQSSSPWNQKEWGGGRESHAQKESKQWEDLENLLMAIVKIDFVQQKCEHSALC